MKRIILYGLACMLLGLLTEAQPPNNAIFFGSGGDGFTRLSNGVTSNSIFVGGAGDGFSNASNGIASNNIFRGSIGDGFSFSTNNAVSNIIFNGGAGDGFNFSSNNAISNTIFIGGVGDGFSNNGNAAPSNIIFSGGIGDGWSNAINVSASNNIFRGGVGDGWSAVYLPQGPLPVTLLYFTARKQTATSALLQWQTSQEINTASFDVERSTDAVQFSKIGNVTAAGNSSVAISYDFTDNNPARGMNYYRLKQIDADGRFVYSPARLVVFNQLDAATVKYYPNPTNGMLFIELSQVNVNEATIINITNISGAVVNQFKLASISGNKLKVDLSTYAKGIYFIQVRTPTLNSTQRIVLQ